MAKKYLFTDKNHSPRAIMSTVLGVISAGGVAYAVYATFQNGGLATEQLGSTGAIILLMSTIGVVLGFLSKSEPDHFYLFSHVGIILNILVLLFVSLILYAGAYGV